MKSSTESNICVKKILKGYTYEVMFSCGTLSITINRNNRGKIESLNVSSSLDIPCFSQLDVISKMITCSILSGADELSLVKNLSEMICFNNKNNKDKEFTNCLQTIGAIIKEDYYNWRKSNEQTERG